jgi:hypothetical protein
MKHESTEIKLDRASSQNFNHRIMQQNMYEEEEGS